MKLLWAVCIMALLMISTSNAQETSKAKEKAAVPPAAASPKSPAPAFEIATSKLLPFGEHNGLYHDSGTACWYKINVKGQHALQIKLLFSHVAGDLDLELYQDGKLLTRSRSFNDNETIRLRTPQPGIYYLKILGAANHYNLSIKQMSWESPPATIPADIWQACWQQQPKRLDFTNPAWGNLDHARQCEYAGHYQAWYASRAGAPTHKTVLLPALAKDEKPVTLEMVFIPPGQFWMGSTPQEVQRGNDEVRHRVVISQPFWIGKYEITNQQYLHFARGRYLPTWMAPGSRYNIRTGSDDHYRNLGIALTGDQHPLVGITWYAAAAFCQEMGLALPSEAQWEYACRAGTTAAFNLGKDITSLQVNYNGNYPYLSSDKQLYRSQLLEVGSLPNANAWGAFDFHGNVFEWCRDYYHPYPTQEVVVDPGGPESGDFRCFRGGSWYSHAVFCRSAERSFIASGNHSITVGFRVVQPLR